MTQNTSSASHSHTVPPDPAIDTLRQDVDDLTARVTALEAANTGPHPIPPSPDKVATAASIPIMKTLLLDDSIDKVILRAGPYASVSAGLQRPESLWFDGAHAKRTRPVIVDCTGAIISGGGISFNDGGGAKHDWQGLRFADQDVSSTGVIVLGGYKGLKAPHDLTLRKFTVDASCHRVNMANALDHALYFSYALDDWANILIEDFSVDASSQQGLASGIHMDHGGPADAPNVAAHGVTVRRFSFKGNPTIKPQQAILLWSPPIHDWLFDGASITDPGNLAIRFESAGAKNIVFKDIVANKPFYSGIATGSPLAVPGVTFQNCTPSGFTA